MLHSSQLKIMWKHWNKENNKNMDAPSEQPRKYCVFGYWQSEKGHPYVYKDGKIELHIYDDIDKALDFIKEHSQWNVNITWCLTWDIYEIQKLEDISL